MQNLGATMFNQKRFEDSATLLEKTAAVAVKTFSKDDSFFCGFRLLYGKCLTQLERYEDAEAQLLDSHALVVKLWGAKDRRARIVADELVTLYDAWHKPQEAQNWSPDPATSPSQ